MFCAPGACAPSPGRGGVEGAVCVAARPAQESIATRRPVLAIANLARMFNLSLVQERANAAQQVLYAAAVKVFLVI